MLDFIMGSSVPVKTILACSVPGIISFIVLAFSYGSMIRATKQIGNSKKKWLVSLKKKYLDYHEMNVKVNNTETFVDKVLQKKKACGLPRAFWRTLFKLTIAACAITGAAGALQVSQGGGDLTEVMLTYLTGITAASALLFLAVLLRAEEKEQRVRLNMNDYLDNVLKNSIAGESGEQEGASSREQRRRLARYARENGGRGARKANTGDEPLFGGAGSGAAGTGMIFSGKSAPNRTVPAKPVSMEEKKLLEDVLQEFFA